MMNNVLGEKVFLDGLQSYLRKYAFSNAVTDDLWNSLSQVITGRAEMYVYYMKIQIRYRDDNTWACEDMKFILSVEQNIVRVSKANECDITRFGTIFKCHL